MLLFLASCNISKNKTIYNERVKKDILIGECNRKAFNKSPFNEWFKPEYEAYKPDSSIIQKLKTSGNINHTEILVVFGTWCGDSRRELPRFYKMIEKLSFPDSKITLIAVDLKKESGDESLKNINFTRIPTFIFYKDRKEIGRIVESTDKSLEEDLLDIIQ